MSAAPVRITVGFDDDGHACALHTREAARLKPGECPEMVDVKYVRADLYERAIAVLREHEHCDISIPHFDLEEHDVTWHCQHCGCRTGTHADDCALQAVLAEAGR